LRGIGEFKEYNDKCFEVVPSYGNSGLVGYILTPESARFLVDQFPSINCPVDHYVLGMGFSRPSPYTVFAPKANLIGHGIKSSLRATGQYSFFERLREGRNIISNLYRQLPVIRSLYAKYQIRS
jgi:hypothetical protein